MAKNMRKNQFVSFISFIFVLMWTFTVTNMAKAEPIDSIYVDEIQLIIGELEVVKVYSLTRISITDPSVADIVEADGNSLLIIGKSIGQTAMFIWDEHGKRTVMLEVSEQDLDFVRSRVEKLLNSAEIDSVELEINEKEGVVVLTGEVPEDKISQLDIVIAPLGDKLLNLVEEEDSEDLIQIDMQITELNTTLSKDLGIEWASSEGALSFSYQESIPTFDGSIGDLFKIGEFTRQNGMVAGLNLLVEEGKGRILSRPKLVVVSGEEANFLVGGEIPIRTTTTTDGSIQSNVEFKEFGISMSITPEIKKGKVDVILDVEVSDVDASNAVGEDVAFVTRTASTHLILEDRQTVVLAGLIKQNRSEQLKRIPILGDLPVFGSLFRNKATVTPDLDQELVITLTPSILNSEWQANNLKKRQKLKEDSFVVSYDDIIPNEPIPAEMQEYVRSVQRKIAEGTVYPKEAQDNGLEGTVKVGMLILKDGTLAFALVKESSGYEVMDKVALDTAKLSAPYDNFPQNTNLEEINITIPIVYSLSKK